MPDQACDGVAWNPALAGMSVIFDCSLESLEITSTATTGGYLIAQGVLRRARVAAE